MNDLRYRIDLRLGVTKSLVPKPLLDRIDDMGTFSVILLHLTLSIVCDVVVGFGAIYIMPIFSPFSQSTNCRLG